MNIFERAARSKLRFASSVGALSVEDLFDLPLTARGAKPDLDTVARGINRELKDLGEESFVDTKPFPKKAVLDLQMEIVKHVIAAKQADEAAAIKAAETRAEKAKLMDLLSRKKDESLASLSEAEIVERLKALG